MFEDPLDNDVPTENQKVGALLEHIRVLAEEQRKVRLNQRHLSPMEFQRQKDLAQKGWSAISCSNQLPHDPEMLKSFGVIRRDP